MRKTWIGIVVFVVAAGGFGALVGHSKLGGEPLAVALLSLLGASLAANAGLALLDVERRRAISRMRNAAEAFRDLYENISEGVFRSTLDGRMISANPSLVRLNGYATEAELLTGVNDIGDEWYVDPNRRAELHQLLLEQDRVANFVSEIYRHKTRERIWIEESTRLVRDKATGEPLHYDGTVREVTETIRRLELQDRYDKIASIVSGCLYQYRLTADGQASMPYASVGLVHLFGLRPGDVAEDAGAIMDQIHPEDIDEVRRSIQQSRETLADWQCEFRVCLPDGRAKWLLGHSSPEREEDGSTLWHGFLTDISERKRSEAKIYDLAYFDPLTRLPNRTMLRDSLRQAIAAARDGAWRALFFIDLDEFKILNDSEGHDVGDRLLCEVAERLRRIVRAGDMVARLGGDEFVVLLNSLCCDDGLARLKVQSKGEAILAALTLPFLDPENPFRTSASIGAALFRDDGRDVDDLLKCADLAMYEAKAGGRGTLRFFAPDMQKQIQDRLALSSDLRDAIGGDELSLAYQPQVDRSGTCFAAEALLRWRHPSRGQIPPTDIISLADRHGLINGLEEWVLKSACATLRDWRRDPVTRDLKLAVNVSAHQLNRRGFVAMVRDALDQSGADPRRLCIELTEHVMLDNIEDVSAVMRELKGLGVSFALDDFGTGYSSLSYLKRLPIDALKIDRSFVRDLETDPSDREIVQTIVNIATSLHVSVVAEGVETDMQALLLRQMGCDAYQGYLYGKPMPLEAFLRHLDAEREESPAGPVHQHARVSW